MSSFPTLGITIPTYRRGAMLRTCLESIIPQALMAGGRVMVWICDNSEDTAAEREISDLLEEHQWIHYERNPENLGAAPNVLKVVGKADTDFVWMMGDDDIMMPGAMALVLKELDDRPELNGILLNYCSYDVEMRTVVRSQNFDITSRMEGRDRFFADGREMLKRASFHIGALSVLVVRRLAWEAIIATKSPTCYFQSYIMSFIYGKVAARYGNWSYLDTVTVGCRVGNDSWWEDGRFLERLGVIVLGGEALFKELFPEDEKARRDLYRHTCRHFVGANIRGVIDFGAPPSFRISVARLCWQYYKSLPDFYTHILPSLLMPRWVLVSIRGLRKRGARSSSSGSPPRSQRGPTQAKPPISSLP